MADQKKWFKVWTSILSDSHFDPERPEALASIGRFIWLGAYLALHGERGKAVLLRDTIERKMKADLASLKRDIVLKNVSFEEAKTGNDEIIVTMTNWHKYQVDSSSERVAKWKRSKKRREEIRGEETRREENIGEEKPLLPEWLSGELWDKYRDHRKRLGKSLTKYAEERALGKLARLRDEGQDVAAVINQSIEENWQGLFAIKNGRPGKPTGGDVFRKLSEDLPSD